MTSGNSASKAQTPKTTLQSYDSVAMSRWWTIANRTINVFEWDKMTYTWKSIENESISKEIERPSHLVDGIQIIDVSVYSNMTLYASRSTTPPQTH